jgi:hypothetical protein
MSLLATVTTKVGKVELHCEGGVFTTRGTLRVECALPTGRQSYTTIILITAARAREWHELADREGHVYLPFPQPEAATIERTLP